jgi:predicted alpha/beta-hydrolase family hydrolase
VTTSNVDTPHGSARVHLHPAEEPRAALVLGHGAGGGVGAPYLVLATEVANDLGIAVALVEQPLDERPLARRDSRTRSASQAISMRATDDALRARTRDKARARRAGRPPGPRRGLMKQ